MRGLLATLLVLSLAGCDAAGRLTGPNGQEEYDPLALLLTWREDPTTTMVVDWHSSGDESSGRRLRFRRVGALFWKTARPAELIAFPFSDRSIHRVHLDGLRPGSEYEFRVGADGRTYRFRTMPAALTRPVRFLAGGDMLQGGVSDAMERTSRAAMAFDPDFAVVAGDIAYADARPDRVERWYGYLNAYRRTLITLDGRLLPIIHAVGNHEVVDGYWLNRDRVQSDDAARDAIAPYFLALLAFPSHPGYAVLDVGDYLSLVVLDSDHIGPVDGAQTEWLARVLEERAHRPHVIPVYHVPAYPSVRRYDGAVTTRVREHWVPVFERHRVSVAFEAHDHAYKRTHPIRAGTIDTTGITYLGDGAWGAEPRQIGSQQPDAFHPWYLARAEAIRHVIVVTIHPGMLSFRTVAEDGGVIDEHHVGVP